jgi:hypothetical protein
MSEMFASVGPSAYWYLTRSTGVVSLLLLTASVVLGVVNVSRWSRPLWPRFVLDSLHRSVSMLALTFLGVHILTAVLDSFAPISLLDAVVPFIGSYRPFWLGLGAVAFDLLLAVTITSVARHRLGYRAWRVTHWLAYACWPIALLHSFGTGSDVKSSWLLALSGACILAVLAAVGIRAIQGWPAHRLVRVGSLASAALLALGLVLWLPGGPLGNDWARRSGTPVALLASSVSSRHAPRATEAAGERGSRAGALSAPFRASLVGTISQGPGPAPGLVDINIATTFGGSASGQLGVQIDGESLPEGGVALGSSLVTLGSTSTPAVYQGRITALNGTRMAAKVRRSDGGELSLAIALDIHQNSGTVSGSLASSPVASAEGK